MTLETLLWIGIIGALTAGIAAIFIARLVIEEVVNWFRSKSDIKLANKNNIAFTLQKKLNSGNFKTVQGVFDTGRSQIRAARAIESERMDPEMQNLHRGNELVVYE
jgi:D-arabinose 1-dehydrogenase-like Zn-dependent alcohol dehydrogenase